MDLRLILNFVFISFANAAVVDYSNSTVIPDNVFNGVYSECFLHLSYSCLQTKTLLYLKELNNLSEVSVIGDYVKFVKINMSDIKEGVEDTKSGDTEELAFMIDEAIDNFFDNHVLKFYALGRNLSMPRNVEEFVGRKKRKGGGGGMMGGHGGGGHDDGGKKKMMMMAMMCMKMKLMMMVPAMMGMMGMMSFKGMMFSMMSFMISKMMLLMKILEKKGGGIGGGGGGGGLDGGWAAGGTGGGAWMPAGGQDYAGGGGGGGGGYDANGQWQSRSIIETPETYKTIQVTDIRQVNKEADGRMPTNNEKWYIKTDEIKPVVRNSDKWQSDKSMLVKAKNVGQWRSRSIDENPFEAIENKPTITFVKPVVRYNNKIETESYKNPVLFYKKSNVNFDFDKQDNDNGSGDRDIDVNQRTKRDTGYENKEQIIKVVQGQVQNKIFNGDQHVNADIANKLVGNKLNFKSRQKRSLIDMLQNSYIYWVNKILGLNNNRRTNLQRYKIINGIKYVYTPYRVQKQKMPKEIQINSIKNAEDIRTMVAVEDFNKGEIVEGGIESRMNKKKFNKMKDSVNDTMDDNPWE